MTLNGRVLILKKFLSFEEIVRQARIKLEHSMKFKLSFMMTKSADGVDREWDCCFYPVFSFLFQKTKSIFSVTAIMCSFTLCWVWKIVVVWILPLLSSSTVKYLIWSFIVKLLAYKWDCEGALKESYSLQGYTIVPGHTWE